MRPDDLFFQQRPQRGQRRACVRQRQRVRLLLDHLGLLTWCMKGMQVGEGLEVATQLEHLTRSRIKNRGIADAIKDHRALFHSQLDLMNFICSLVGILESGKRCSFALEFQIAEVFPMTSCPKQEKASPN